MSLDVVEFGCLIEFVLSICFYCFYTCFSLQEEGPRTYGLSNLNAARTPTTHVTMQPREGERGENGRVNVGTYDREVQVIRRR